MTKQPLQLTTTAMQRFGFVHCPGCNPKKLPSHDIPAEVQCAWCYDKEGAFHYRYVKVEVLKKWRLKHGLSEDDEDDIPTSPESRQAFESLKHDALPDTDPAPVIDLSEEEP